MRTNQLLYLILPIILLSACKKQPNSSIKQVAYDQLGEYVAAYINPDIHISDALRYVLVQKEGMKEVSADEVISINPKVNGSAQWDGSTLIFTPSEMLNPDATYHVSLDLTKVYAEVPSEIRSVSFPVSTMPYTINHESSMSSSSANNMSVSGTITTNMKATDQWVEQGLNLQPKHNITWTHSTDGKSHSYAIADISREDEAKSIKITFDQKGYKGNLSQRLSIPAKGVFEYQNMGPRTANSQSIDLRFSEQLDPNQKLDGLVTIDNYRGKIRLSASRNILTITPADKINGTAIIHVLPGIKSAFGNALKKETELEITFKPANPKLKLLGKGSIVPNINQVIFPFEAIGLDAVDVEVFKIYDSNIMQFLENNTISDLGYSLQSVGNIVHQEKVNLKDIGEHLPQQWQRYAIDISRLTKLDPAAIYQVRIGFRRAYTEFATDADEEIIPQKNRFDEYVSIMNVPRVRPYDYNKRDDPAFLEYYDSYKFIKRNLLSSYLGLTAKVGKDRQLSIAALDIRNAQPLSGVELQVYNTQKQLTSTISTSSDGVVQLQSDALPRYIVAKHNNTVGYVSLQDYRANSLTDFPITGKNNKTGIDGYIYGERGVWRPGDSLHLTFVLEDKAMSLPIDHPVVFSLYDPKGTRQHREVSTHHVGHMYAFVVPTESNATTGNWKAEVEVGDQLFTKRVKIETVKPNRLKIDFPFLDKQLDYSKDHTIALESKWLHGADANGLKAKVELRLEPKTTKFESYPSFAFDDPARKIDQLNTVIFDGKLNAEGKANIKIEPSVSMKPAGMLRANIKSMVYEPSGNFSEDNMKVVASPYQNYVGVKVPKTRWGSRKINIEDNEPIEIVVVDADGNPVRNKSLSLGLYKARWRWWYNRNDNNLYSYNSSQHIGAIDQVDLTTDTNGRAQWKTGIDDYGSFLVRVCDPVGGHCTGQLFYAGHRWQRAKNTGNQGASLAIESDKEIYQVGEKAKISIPSNAGSQILVSIENNKEVIQEYWVDGEKDITHINIDITEDMTPNVYVHLSLIQPYDKRENDLPLRIYGVKSITVENPDAILYPEIITAEKYEPKQSYQVKVKEKNARAMTYTVAVVDEGLLDLTRFKTPDLYKHFNSKQSLGVKTWDIYDHVLNGYGADIERIISIGGDGEINLEKSGAKANRFKPVVAFSGPHYVAAGETAMHEFDMPNYVGAVRVMVVARAATAYGSTDKSVPVKSDLMVLPTLPRVLAPGESLSLPVSVFSMNDNVRNVSVSASTNNLVNIDGSDSRSLNFTKQGDQLTSFHIQVKDQLGIAEFDIAAAGNGKRATQSVEVDVRNPNPYETRFEEKVLKAGESWNMNFSPFGEHMSNTGALELSNIPPINLERRLNYLIRYPYGCVEQTTSSVFPQLYLSNLMDLEPRKQKEIEANIKSGIQRLRSFQRLDGGLSYWPGANTANHWGTNYAGHFLIEAKRKGYYVPDDMMKGWIKFQTQASNNNHGHSLEQAYRLYTLSLAGSANWSAMNRMKSGGNLENTSAILLAAAYAIGGQQKVADEIKKQVISNINYKPEGDGYAYGSYMRNRAMTARALLHISNDEDAGKLIQEIAKDLGSNNWYSTQSTAAALMAVSEFVNRGNKNSIMDYEITVSGSPAILGSSDKSLYSLPVNVASLGSGSIAVKNRGEGVLFARWIQQAKPKMGEWKSEQNHIALSVKYKSMDGNVIDPSQLKKGDDFIVETTVKNPGTRLRKIENIALHQVFPSGWEIQNERITDGIKKVESDYFTHQDIRDDRIYTFFNLSSGEKKIFRHVMTAAYAGKFFLPDHKVQAMYDKEIRARVAGQKVEVIN